VVETRKIKNGPFSNNYKDQDCWIERDRVTFAD